MSDRAPTDASGEGRPLEALLPLQSRLGLLRRLASLRLTLWLVAALALGTLAAFRLEGMRTWPLVAPLLLLALNLIAAVATNGVFRRQTALLVFHLSLIALIILVAAGRLTYLKGNAGVTEGTSFEGQLAESERGPWHRDRLAQSRFVNRGFSVTYAPGLQRGPTRNQVAWQGTDGSWHEIAIGDQTPLVLNGYRFYTSYNKGFAPTFAWTDRSGQTLTGSVQLPPYPLQEYSQAAEWALPGSTTVLWIMLDIDEVVLDASDRTNFRLPEQYQLVVRIGDERHTMRPGDVLELPEGQLRFEGLRSWMGYRVFYDWTLPWLFAAALVGVISLAVHFMKKFSARPWDAV